MTYGVLATSGATARHLAGLTFPAPAPSPDVAWAPAGAPAPDAQPRSAAATAVAAPAPGPAPQPRPLNGPYRPVLSNAELDALEREASGEDPPGAGYFFAAADSRVMPTLALRVQNGTRSSLPVDSEQYLDAELWGRLTLVPGDAPAPLAVLLHGSHDICSGWDNNEDTCAAYAARDPLCSPVPNHAGYAYLAAPLTAAGLHVLSVNVNAALCIGDGPGAGPPEMQGMALGAAVLAHLEQLRHWDRHGGAPRELGLSGNGRLDLARTVLMGHSRGGEGVLAAQTLLLNDPMWRTALPDVKVVGIAEVAPVDNFTGRELTPMGQPWLTLLPTCDGDVFNLQGMWPLDRLFAGLPANEASAKGALVLRGGNHRGANSVWAPVPDQQGCEDGAALSPAVEQQVVAEVLTSFFADAAAVSGSAGKVRLLEPTAALPAALEALTRIERTLLPGDAVGTRQRLTDVAVKALPWVASTPGPTVTLDARAENMTAIYAPVDVRDAAVHTLPMGITLTVAPGADAGAFTMLWSAAGTGIDLSGVARLSFRLGRATVGSDAQASAPTPVSLQLVGADGSLSRPYEVPTRALPLGPGAVIDGDGNRIEHLILSTVSVSPRDFPAAALHQVGGLRLSFRDAAGVRMVLADVLVDGVAAASRGP